jgi:hypothetical protein
MPKEPAGLEVDGTWYLATAVWNAYEPANLTNRDVCLFKSDNPFTGFEQVSKVTDADADKDAPGLAYADGELWVFYGDREAQQLTAKRADEDNIPSNPSGWTDVGKIAEGVDPKSIWNVNDTYYVAFQAKFGDENTKMISGPDLSSLGNQTEIYAGNDVGRGQHQAPDIVPRGDGGWVLSTFHDHGGQEEQGNQLAVSDTIDGVYEPVSGDEWVSPGRIMGQAVDNVDDSWYGQWTVVHSTVCTKSLNDLATYNGHYISYFEGGDGNEHRVGAIAVPKQTTGDQPKIIGTDLQI